MSNTAARVRKIITAKFSVDEAHLVPEASFVSDLGADSLNIVEISMAIEKEFDIEISDEDIESTKTLGDLEQLIGAKSQVMM
jgi:acyl carrier protein